MIKNTAQDQRLPPNLPPQDFEQLPEKPGVYYFYNHLKKVIYIGKAVNIKKRVASHFTGHKITSQRQNFLREIHSISFEICATELMALLLECTEIQKLWPTYNKALKKYQPKYGLYQYEARNGYIYLAIGKLNKFQSCIEHFSSLYEGINLLQSMARQFELDYRFCNYGNIIEDQPSIKPKTTNLPDIDLHNEKVENAILFLQSNKQNFAIIDKGRTPDERSCIWIENGHFYGMGYMATDVGFINPAEIKDFVTPYSSNHYIMQLILNYAEKFPSKVFWQKTENQNE